MDATLLVYGIIIGLVMTAPVGPVNVLVVRNAIRAGFPAAFLIGLASSLADGLYAAAAAYGVGSIATFIEDYERPLLAAGGLLLVVMGVRLARSRGLRVESGEELSPRVPGLAAPTLSAFMLTLTNPGVLFGFAAIFGMMNSILQLHADSLRPALLVAGVLIGDLLWWLLLSSVVARYRTRINERSLARVNRWTAILITAFGFVLLFEAVS
jgi:threonine/homoserine/homoserine lactone efflux protein